MYGVFISHSWVQDADYWSVVVALESTRGLQWTNLSVPEHEPVDFHHDSRLESELRTRISKSNAVILCSGMWSERSSWIRFELEFAKSIGRPIIAVPPRGTRELPVAFVASAMPAQLASMVTTVANIGEPLVTKLVKHAYFKISKQ